jgi:hypothetical protein
VSYDAQNQVWSNLGGFGVDGVVDYVHFLRPDTIFVTGMDRWAIFLANISQVASNIEEIVTQFSWMVWQNVEYRPISFVIPCSVCHICSFSLQICQFGIYDLISKSKLLILSLFTLI